MNKERNAKETEEKNKGKGEREKGKRKIDRIEGNQGQRAKDKVHWSWENEKGTGDKRQGTASNGWKRKKVH